MNREQIDQMARDAGFGHYDDYSSGWKDTLDRFAYAIRAATKEEDAKICEEVEWIDGGHLPSNVAMARAIRASK